MSAEWQEISDWLAMATLHGTGGATITMTVEQVATGVFEWTAQIDQASALWLSGILPTAQASREAAEAAAGRLQSDL